MASTHIAAQAPPFDWTPPSITIPDLIVVKCGYVRFICGNFSDDPKRSAWTGPKFQSVVGVHIDDARSYKLIWMKKLSSVRPFSLDGCRPLSLRRDTRRASSHYDRD